MRHLARLAGYGALGEWARCLALADLDFGDIDFLDLYSCFPIAVQTYADALGVTEGNDYTFTGGMPFAGGPLNNYVFQSTCRLVELLREYPNSHGLISSVSGMLTKQGFGVFSTQSGFKPFRSDDVTAEVETLQANKQVLEEHSGDAVIAAYTVLYQNGNPWRVVAIYDVDEDIRAVAISEDAVLINVALTEEICGRKIVINGKSFDFKSA